MLGETGIGVDGIMPVGVVDGEDADQAGGEAELVAEVLLELEAPGGQSGQVADVRLPALWVKAEHPDRYMVLARLDQDLGAIWQVAGEQSVEVGGDGVQA